MNEENKNNAPPQEDNQPHGSVEETLKKAVMATIGTLTDAVEKLGGVIAGVVNKENIDKMAQKGEKTFKQVKDFTVETAHTVKDFTVDTYDKVKQAMTPAEEDVSSALTSAADSLRDALDKARLALQHTASKENMEKVGNSLLQEMSDQWEALEAFIQKLRDIAEEEAEMVKQELEEMEEIDEEPLEHEQEEDDAIQSGDAEENPPEN